MRFLTIPEVAKKLGVTDETVKNWIKYGALKTRDIGGWQRIDGETLEALFDKLSDVAEMERNIDELRKACYKMRGEYRQMAKTVKADNTLLYLMHRTYIDKSLLQSITYTVGHGLINERDLEMLLDFISHGSVAQLTKDYGIQPERVKQVLVKGFQKIRYSVSYADIVAENKEMKVKINAVSREIKCLKDENDVLKAQISILTGVPLPQGVSGLTEKERNMCRVLDKSVFELPLPVRYHQCFKMLDIETVGDLIAVSGYDLMKVRNFGKKGVHAVEELLKVYKLTLGMDLSELRRRYAIYIAEEQLKKKQEEEKESA